MTGPHFPTRAEQVEVRRDTPVREQVAPGATTDTTLYTVPKGKTAHGRVFFCNRGGAAGLVRIALRKAGAALANQHYLVYDFSVAVGSYGQTEELDLDTDDVLTVRCSTADASFNFNGIERYKQK